VCTDKPSAKEKHKFRACTWFDSDLCTPHSLIDAHMMPTSSHGCFCIWRMQILGSDEVPPLHQGCLFNSYIISKVGQLFSLLSSITCSGDDGSKIWVGIQQQRLQCEEIRRKYHIPSHWTNSKQAIQ